MIGADHVTARAAAISKGATYSIAGKTGTAQVFTVSRSERLTQNVAERLRDHAWFIAFAPVEAPRIAVAVLVENGGFGASAAAPIARKVMDAYLLRQTSAPANAGIGPRIGSGGRTVHGRHRLRAHAPHAVSSARLLSALNLDGPLLVGLALLALYGLAILYSASGQSVDTVLRTVMRLALGTAAMLALTHASPNFLRRLAPWLYAVGHRAAGGGRGHRRHRQGRAALAQSWTVPLPALRDHEARRTHARRLVSARARPLPPDWRSLLVLAVIIFLPAGLVAMQPDLGTAALIAASGALLVLMAGLSLRIVIALALAGVGCRSARLALSCTTTSASAC